MTRRAPAAPGFTLVEILSAMAILAIGLSACVGLVIGTTRAATAASDRNIAAILVPEAIAAIERNHLITELMPGVAPGSIPAADVGLLIETLQSPNPNIHDVPYCDAIVNNVKMDYRLPPPYMPPPTGGNGIYHTSLWPLGVEPAYYAGPLRDTGTNQDPTGNAFRVVYRLERHPDWHAHSADYGVVPAYDPENPLSAFRGVYQLTLVVYRDPNRDARKLEQICDPVVVYLRDKKVR